MKKNILFLLSTFISTLIFAQQIDSVSIHSEAFNTDRKILIYTPWEYKNVPNSGFEVIYVFDAQDVNYLANVYSTLSFLNKGLFPMIVVGIVSTERNKDFLPKNDFPKTAKGYGNYLGNANLFLRFVGDEVIPYVESHYRTLPKRIAIGHSNGGTFLMYSLSQRPNLFDAYIAISPNWAYDKQQPLRRIEKLNTLLIAGKKFLYMCNANESIQWKDWGPARKKAIALFKTVPYKKEILFTNQNFSKTENHSSVFPIGVFYGLKHYLDYQFFTADNLISYYKTLESKKIVNFTADQLNQLAYSFYYSYDTAGGIKILLWANSLFPNNLNLYDSLGELYQNNKQPDEALKFYKLYQQKLEQQKSTFTKEAYDVLKKGIESRINYLYNQK